MKHESFSGKPRVVQDAVVDLDTQALRAMGRKGAEIANKKKVKEAEERDAVLELNNERAQRDEYERVKSANFHVLDEDGKSPNLDERSDD